MVCGTASDVGKSHLVTALCRILHRRGTRVAPFKAQNMALNSAVTPGGQEIGRAQAVQARAAGIDAEVAMNPVLVKPTGERTSQVVVMGRPWGHHDAASFQAAKSELRVVVLAALADLRSRHDVVILEGAGSPSEINLLDNDIVNLRLAAEIGAPALVIGDIDRGGVFAALYGTVALLPDGLRRLVRGFVINKFRGDRALLGDGLADLERRCGVPTLGVLPWIHDVGLDAEDSLSLRGHRPSATQPSLGDTLDVAVIRLPRIANFTDFEALETEPGVGVRMVDHPEALGDPDLIVVPGTKTTVADLGWLRGIGLDLALRDARARGSVILGICGGYQMLGTAIDDQVESGRAGEPVVALGWLDVSTVFGADKVTRQRRGRAMGQPLCGYEIHHGLVERSPRARPWARLDDGYGNDDEGATDDDGQVVGTTLHGLFDNDGLRRASLGDVARRRGRNFVAVDRSFAAARETQIDRLADMVEANLDLAAVDALLKEPPC
ncbi:MAG: cobyric acid synthase [Actinomycetota bacterium]|nr:cobyric acid synthase [Actinomycetota bacterium]